MGSNAGSLPASPPLATVPTAPTCSLSDAFEARRAALCLHGACTLLNLSSAVGSTAAIDPRQGVLLGACACDAGWVHDTSLFWVNDCGMPSFWLTLCGAVSAVGSALALGAGHALFYGGWPLVTIGASRLSCRCSRTESSPTAHTDAVETSAPTSAAVLVSRAPASRAPAPRRVARGALRAALDRVMVQQLCNLASGVALIAQQAATPAFWIVVGVGVACLASAGGLVTREFLALAARSIRRELPHERVLGWLGPLFPALGAGPFLVGGLVGIVMHARGDALAYNRVMVAMLLACPALQLVALPVFLATAGALERTIRATVRDAYEEGDAVRASRGAASSSMSPSTNADASGGRGAGTTTSHAGISAENSHRDANQRRLVKTLNNLRAFKRAALCNMISFVICVVALASAYFVLGSVPYVWIVVLVLVLSNTAAGVNFFVFARRPSDGSSRGAPSSS